MDTADSISHGIVNDQRDVTTTEAHVAPVRDAVARLLRETERLRAIVAAAVALREAVAPRETGMVRRALDGTETVEIECFACGYEVDASGPGHADDCPLVAFDRVRGER